MNWDIELVSLSTHTRVKTWRIVPELPSATTYQWGMSKVSSGQLEMDLDNSTEHAGWLWWLAEFQRLRLSREIEVFS